MPSELRHLLFQPPEVLQALRAYHHTAGRPLPAGDVVRCGPETSEHDGAVRFRIILIPAALRGDSRTPVAPDRHQPVVVEAPSLVAALILHCRDRGIPLPAKAEKSLKVVGEQLCLVTKISAKRPDQPDGSLLRL